MACRKREIVRVGWDEIRVVCQTLNGSSTTVQLSYRRHVPTVLHLKQAIAAEMKNRMHGVWTMHLYYGSKCELDDTQPLHAYGIEDLSTVTFVVKQAQLIRIEICGPNGNSNTLTMSSCATVGHLKTILERKWGHNDRREMMVEFKGRPLSDKTSFQVAGIRDGAKLTIRLVPRKAPNKLLIQPLTLITRCNMNVNMHHQQPVGQVKPTGMTIEAEQHHPSNRRAPMVPPSPAPHRSAIIARARSSTVTSGVNRSNSSLVSSSTVRDSFSRVEKVPSDRSPINEAKLQGAMADMSI